MFFSFFNFCFGETLVLSTQFNGLSSFQILFQDPASPMMEGIIHLHHDIMFLMIFIVFFVGWALFQTIFHFSQSKNHLASTNTHGTVLEIVWTTIPSLILIGIAIPTFALLYAMDEGISPAITLKVIGHQWYWSYEYSDFSFIQNKQKTFEMDCFMVQENDLVNFSQFRLLETDTAIVLPVDTHIRVVVSGVDVLHCWAIPALGVKMDACPGRLNQLSMYINRVGLFYGQCSEICGANHAFMPIMLVATTFSSFVSWIATLHLYFYLFIYFFLCGLLFIFFLFLFFFFQKSFLL